MRRALVAALLAACTAGPQPLPKVCGTNSGAGMLADFSIPCDPGANGILITMSGESFAKNGYAFPPLSPDDVVFVDGWALTYDRVLSTVDHITLSRDPDKSPTDQSQCDDGNGNQITCGTGSSVLAEVDGPFAMDLHLGGALADAAGAPLDAAPIAALTGLNQQGNDAFDPEALYAFGFEVVPASASAQNVNLDAAALADYATMVQAGYTTLLVGTATWQGANSSCTQTAVTPAYDFGVLPTTVHFKLGITAPTYYRNAQNPALQGMAFPGEEHPRGVQTSSNQATIAQITLHLDHAFWESFVHDSPAHFDSFASRFAGQTSVSDMTMEDFRSYGFAPFIDAQGNEVPWRSCLPVTDYTPPGTSAMSFDTESVPINLLGDPAQVIRDFSDYTRYNQSTFGHLNADGLSFVDRQYPSPP
jgi:hypothetical protein